MTPLANVNQLVDVADLGQHQTPPAIRAKMFLGSPRALISLPADEPYQLQLRELPGCALTYSVLQHREGRNLLHLIRENDLVDTSLSVAGLLAPSSSEETGFEPPLLAPTASVRLQEVVVAVDKGLVSLLIDQVFQNQKFDAVVDATMISKNGRVKLDNTASVHNTVSQLPPVTLVGLRLVIALHNARTVVSTQRDAGLKEAAQAGRTGDAARQGAHTWRYEHDGAIELQYYAQDGRYAIVVELVADLRVPYIVSTPNKIEYEYSKRAVVMGWVPIALYDPKRGNFVPDGAHRGAFRGGPEVSPLGHRVLSWSGLPGIGAAFRVPQLAFKLTVDGRTISDASPMQTGAPPLTQAHIDSLLPPSKRTAPVPPVQQQPDQREQTKVPMIRQSADQIPVWQKGPTSPLRDSVDHETPSVPLPDPDGRLPVRDGASGGKPPHSQRVEQQRQQKEEEEEEEDDIEESIVDVTGADLAEEGLSVVSPRPPRRPHQRAPAAKRQQQQRSYVDAGGRFHMLFNRATRTILRESGVVSLVDHYGKTPIEIRGLSHLPKRALLDDADEAGAPSFSSLQASTDRMSNADRLACHEILFQFLAWAPAKGSGVRSWTGGGRSDASASVFFTFSFFAFPRTSTCRVAAVSAVGATGASVYGDDYNDEHEDAEGNNARNKNGGGSGVRLADGDQCDEARSPSC